MRNLHLEKKGLRGLAIAESFRINSPKSILCGVVMRRDLVIDGFVIGNTTISGDDATETILAMYEKLNRPDVSYLLFSGLIISMFNIIDIKKIHEKLKIPVIGITYNDSRGLEEAIKRRFPNSYCYKIQQYQKLGKRDKIFINNTEIFVRVEGCSPKDAMFLLKEQTLQGSFPEPLRIAQLLAKTLLQKGLSF